MKLKIKIQSILIVLLVSQLSYSQTKNADYQAYILKYSDIAQKEKNEFGIPASIILAQGILESGAGKGFLAVTANNHFGIKCTDWKGEAVYYDDDAPGECFRKYPEVINSYEDHSLFLKNKVRYASLFDLEISDYKGWAYGLKKAGYATDTLYPQKLIKIIEDYELYRFDQGSTVDIFSGVVNNKPASEKSPIENAFSQNSAYNRTPSARVAAENTSVKDSKAKTADARKPSNGKTVSSKDGLGEIGAVMDYANHKVKRVNGVNYVEALNGDTYGSIADEFFLEFRSILSYNDQVDDVKLEAGDRVFLKRKKKEAAKGIDFHTIQEGESMRFIAQKYGIILEKLYKMNEMAYDDGATYQRILNLRNMKKNTINPLFGPGVKRLD